MSRTEEDGDIDFPPPLTSEYKDEPVDAKADSGAEHPDMLDHDVRRRRSHRE